MFSGSRFGNYLTSETDDSDVSLKPSPQKRITHYSSYNDAFEAGVFEMDEGLQEENHIESGGYSLVGFQERPPMGRLRRGSSQVPHRVSEEMRFPAMFVEGFRNGHVAFNIPGVLADSLKPTDSVDLRFKYHNCDETPNEDQQEMNESQSSTTDPFLFSKCAREYDSRQDSGLDGLSSFFTNRTGPSRNMISSDSGITPFPVTTCSTRFSAFSSNLT